MAREGSAAWYYEQAIRLRVLATKAVNPHIQAELLQAATRFRTLAAEAEAKAEKKRRARESLAAASSALGERTEAATQEIAAAKR